MTSKVKKRLMTCAMASLSVLITLAFVELLAAKLYRFLTPESGRVAVEILAGERTADDVTGLESHPYLLYQNKPKWVSGGFVQHNSLGHRGPEISPLPANGTLRILCLGGSSTYGSSLPDPEQTWPAQLGKILTKRLGRPVEVINAGLPNGLSADMLSHYLFRDRFLGARIVILHEASNDAIPLMSSLYEPDYGFYRKWVATSFAPRPVEITLLRSHLVRVFYAHWLKRMPPAQFVAQPESLQRLPANEALENARRNQPIGFRRNVDLLVRNIQDDGATAILFPSYLAPREVFEAASRTHDYWKLHYDALETGWMKNVEAMKEIADRRKAKFIRLAPRSLPQHLFTGHGQLNAEGEVYKAAFVADQIEPAARKVASLPAVTGPAYVPPAIAAPAGASRPTLRAPKPSLPQPRTRKSHTPREISGPQP